MYHEGQIVQKFGSGGPCWRAKNLALLAGSTTLCVRHLALTMRFWRGAAAALAACLCLHVAGAVPDGFDEKTIVKASFMTDIAFMPNEDMFVTQKIGLINVYSPDEEYDYGDKVEALDIVDRVCDNGERGLGAIQVHPNFAQNNWV